MHNFYYFDLVTVSSCLVRLSCQSAYIIDNVKHTNLFWRDLGSQRRESTWSPVRSSVGVAASLEVSESPGSIQVARGHTAVLPCTFTTSAALINLNVIWMVIPLSNANQPEQVFLFHPGLPLNLHLFRRG